MRDRDVKSFYGIAGRKESEKIPEAGKRRGAIVEIKRE